jgi:hypothetical protein
MWAPPPQGAKGAHWGSTPGRWAPSPPPRQPGDRGGSAPCVRAPAPGRARSSVLGHSLGFHASIAASSAAVLSLALLELGGALPLITRLPFCFCLLSATAALASLARPRPEAGVYLVQLALALRTVWYWHYQLVLAPGRRSRSPALSTQPSQHSALPRIAALCIATEPRPRRLVARHRRGRSGRPPRMGEKNISAWPGFWLLASIPLFCWWLACMPPREPRGS